MIKAPQPERVGWLMRHQVAYETCNFVRWLKERSYPEWECDLPAAVRWFRLLWVEHLRMRPLPEYPAC